MSTASFGTTAIDLILAGMILEGFCLAAWHRWTGRFVGPRKFLPNLASGMALLLAMRLALAGAWSLAAVALLAAGVAHVLDLLQRGS